MVLEHAVLDVSPARTAEFERAFDRIRQAFESEHGVSSMNLERCHETGARYRLRVDWAGGHGDESQWRRLMADLRGPLPIERFSQPVAHGNF